MLADGHVLLPVFLPGQHTAKTPFSATFGHLRTLLIFYLSHNHLTPSHKSPSPVFCEELCRCFDWYLTLSALEYPWCHWEHAHPPWLVACRTDHNPSSLRCSLRSSSSRFQTFSEKTEGCSCLVRTAQHILHGHWSQLSSFIWSYVQCYWGLMLFFITDALQWSWENKGEE